MHIYVQCTCNTRHQRKNRVSRKFKCLVHGEGIAPTAWLLCIFFGTACKTFTQCNNWNKSNFFVRVRRNARRIVLMCLCVYAVGIWMHSWNLRCSGTWQKETNKFLLCTQCSRQASLNSMLAMSRRRREKHWTACVLLQLCLWIVHRYVLLNSQQTLTEQTF